MRSFFGFNEDDDDDPGPRSHPDYGAGVAGPGCPSQEVLLDFTTGKLSESDARLVTEHIRACNPCRSTAKYVMKGPDAVMSK